MAVMRSMLDPISNKPYDYITMTDREEHLLEVLDGACSEHCPPENTEYLCMTQKVPAADEEEQCCECYRRWAGKVGGANSPRAQRLEQAIELAIQGQCPPDLKDMVCKATEDESTDEEVCAMCIKRWATIPFARFRK